MYRWDRVFARQKSSNRCARVMLILSRPLSGANLQKIKELVSSGVAQFAKAMASKKNVGVVSTERVLLR